jgi:predicted dehydrogenase
MDHISDAILRDQPLRTPGEMGLADMRIIAAIAESVRTGRTVKL